jgi:hypothetical protein
MEPQTDAAHTHASHPTSPPYWQTDTPSASRSAITHRLSSSLKAKQIRLEDHTDEDSDQCRALWAKSARIDGYVVVEGAVPGIGSYVVFNCVVETANVSFVVFDAEIDSCFLC